MTDEVRRNLGIDFPRFLNRDDGGSAAVETEIAPPALKQTWTQLPPEVHAWVVSALPFVTPATVVLCMAGITAAAIFGMQTAPQQTPVLKKEPKVVTAYNREVANAFDLVSAFEARVGYAPNLAEHLQEPEPDELTTAALPEVSEWAMSSSVGLLVLRNLPEKVTFLSGAPAGKGAWAIPSGDPDQLVMTLGEGFDKPVLADVDMVSRAGLPLGTLRLQLLKPGLEQIAAAPDVAAPEEAEKPKTVKKKKRRRRVRVRKAQTLTAAAGQPPSYVSSKPNAANRKPGANPPVQAANAPAAEEEPGPLTSFFSWLAGGIKPNEENQTGFGYQSQ